MRLKCSDFAPFIALFLSLMIPCFAFAAQTVEVIESGTQVYQLPSLASPQVSTLDAGTVVPSSSKTVTDSLGVQWYKIKTPAGAFGYVNASRVVTPDLRREFAAAGVSRAPSNTEESEKGGGTIHLRAMGLGGIELPSGDYELAGEGELSFTLPLASHGYFRRFISLGAVFYYFQTDKVVGGTLNLMLMQTRLRPVLRMRIGQALTAQTLQLGGNLGLEYAFSSEVGFYVSGYLEGGALMSLVIDDPYHVFGAIGLGIHF